MTHTVESLMAQIAVYAEVGGGVHRIALESALREALRAEYLRGIDAAAEKCRGRRAAAGLVVNEILALKEPTP
jgi:hypothetical protein